MKDLVKMLANSYNFYMKNPNLSLTFDDVAVLQKRCDDFLTQLKEQVSQDILQNSLDAIVLTDQMVRVMAINFSEDVLKQYNAINEKDFLVRNLQNIKNNSSSETEYILKLKNLITKITSMNDLLSKAKNDLARLDDSINIIEHKYNYVLDVADKKKLYGKDAFKYIQSVLNNRISMHYDTKSTIKQTIMTIDDLIAGYNTIMLKVSREIEIVSDLHSLREKNAEDVKLLERSNIE